MDEWNQMWFRSSKLFLFFKQFFCFHRDPARECHGALIKRAATHRRHTFVIKGTYSRTGLSSFAPRTFAARSTLRKRRGGGDICHIYKTREQ